MAEKGVVIHERRRRPTVALAIGERSLNILSWQGLLAIFGGLSILYSGAQVIGNVTGLTFGSQTSKKIDKLVEAIEAESQTRAAADSESRTDRKFIRAQMGDLTIAVCGALTPNASKIVRERCDQILTNSLAPH